MANFDNTALALKAVFPTNDLKYDDKGLPGIYVQRQPQFLSALLTGGDGSVHPTFLIGGQQIAKLLIGKYQGVAHNGRMYSLPQEDPRANITLDTIEAYCKAKGDGHHEITAAEWAFLALLCKKQGIIPTRPPSPAPCAPPCARPRNRTCDVERHRRQGRHFRP